MAKKTIEILEDRVAELEEQLEEAERKADYAEAVEDWYWCRPRYEWPDRGLPVPRLEICWRMKGENWRSREALYVLVYRHYSDDKVRAKPLGLTRVDGGDGSPPVRMGEVETPFREGVHLRVDAAHLKLPAFAVVADSDNEAVSFTEFEPLEKERDA